MYVTLLDSNGEDDSEDVVQGVRETLAQNVGVEDRQRVGEGVKVRLFEDE